MAWLWEHFLEFIPYNSACTFKSFRVSIWKRQWVERLLPGPIRLSAYLPAWMFICLYVCRFVCISVFVTPCPPIHLSLCLFVNMIETWLDLVFYITSTPTLLYFVLYFNTVYPAHYVYYTIWIFFVFLLACLLACLLVCLFVCLFVCLSVYLSTDLIFIFHRPRNDDDDGFNDGEEDFYFIEIELNPDENNPRSSPESISPPLPSIDPRRGCFMSDPSRPTQPMVSSTSTHLHVDDNFTRSMPGTAGGYLRQTVLTNVPKGRGYNKKCRLIYGMEKKHLWCTQCRWKKACTRFVD